MLQPKARPTCTAIMVNYNHSLYIGHALDDALNQTIPFDEIIIIDDASTDNSVDIIRQRIAGFSYVRLMQNEKNLGIEPTVNIGLKEATGDFIYFMSADDRYSRTIIEWCRPVLEEMPDIGMVSGNAIVSNAETGMNRLFVLPFPQVRGRYRAEDIAVIAKKRGFTFYGGANLIRRKAILEVQEYLPLFKWHSDWFLYLYMGCRYTFAVVPETFIRIRQTRDQYSHACYDWNKQKHVIAPLLHTLQQYYPEEYKFFRDNALLPTYDIQALGLLLADSKLRHYLTPLLFWRLLTYKLLRALGRALTDDQRAKLRRLLRV